LTFWRTRDAQVLLRWFTIVGGSALRWKQCIRPAYRFKFCNQNNAAPLSAGCPRGAVNRRSMKLESVTSQKLRSRCQASFMVYFCWIFGPARFTLMCWGSHASLSRFPAPPTSLTPQRAHPGACISAAATLYCQRTRDLILGRDQKLPKFSKHSGPKKLF